MADLNSHPHALVFPIPGKIPALDAEPNGFAHVDLATHCPIPIPGAGHPGAFGHERRNHIHEGIDLYGREGDLVVALFGGIVVFNGPFTGPAAGSPWWLPTQAIAIEGPLGVMFHGEIDAFDLPVGSFVAAGSPLGRLARVLRSDKGRPMHMLHLEFYQAGARQSIGIWPLGENRPDTLLDPTALVAHSAGLPWSPASLHANG
jgi:hypothetical protein